jgi:hypothetical protein
MSLLLTIRLLTLHSWRSIMYHALQLSLAKASNTRIVSYKSTFLWLISASKTPGSWPKIISLRLAWTGNRLLHIALRQYRRCSLWHTALVNQLSQVGTKGIGTFPAFAYRTCGGRFEMLWNRGNQSFGFDTCWCTQTGTSEIVMRSNILMQTEYYRWSLRGTGSRSL